MRISTKGRYALRMIIDLANHQNDGYVALKTIADRQDVSKKYLEQIVPILNRGGILITNRGFQGGYMIARSPDKISVGEVLRLTEGAIAPVSCIENEDGPINCDRSDKCPTLPVWRGLTKVINDYLDNITIQDIIDQSNDSSGNDYII